MKKRIAVIGANDFQNPLILKAKELGYETFVYAWKNGDVGEKTADHFIPISIVNKEEIWKDCKEKKVIAAVSIGSDLATHTVNYIQRKLGNPCNPIITDYISTNKYAMRNAFLENQVRCPKYIRVSSIPSINSLSQMKYPLIVKPTDRSGSRGIHKVYDYNELCVAVTDSCNLSFEKSAIIEEYIDGEEFSCESISNNGIHQILAFTKKSTTGAPNFIETGHSEPADISKELSEIFSLEICKGLDALQIKYGASHTEFKIDNSNNIWIIEIGARMGGDCIGSDLVPLSTGYDYVRMVIDSAIGNKLNFDLIHDPKSSEIRFILTEEDLSQYNKLYLQDPKAIIRKSNFNYNFEDRVNDSSTRHGYYIYIK